MDIVSDRLERLTGELLCLCIYTSYKRKCKLLSIGSLKANDMRCDAGDLTITKSALCPTVIQINILVSQLMEQKSR